MFIELSLYTIFILIVTNTIVFSLTLPELEPAIYRTQNKNGNHLLHRCSSESWICISAVITRRDRL